MLGKTTFDMYKIPEVARLGLDEYFRKYGKVICVDVSHWKHIPNSSRTCPECYKELAITQLNGLVDGGNTRDLK